MKGEPTVFEWTLDQWAIAFAAFPQPTIDVAAALACKGQWIEARPLYQPGHARILAADGHKRLEPKDIAAAVKLFDVAPRSAIGIV